MDFGFLEQIGTGVLFQLAAAVLGFIVAVGLGVFVLQRKWVPSPAMAAAVFLVAVSGTAVSLGEGLAWDATDLEAMRRIGITASASRMFAFFLTAPVLGTLLLILAVVGARGEDRQWKLAGAGAVGVLLTVAVTFAGGIAYGDPHFANLRAMVYLAVGALTCVAMLASDPDDTGPEAGAAAALCYPIFVATGEGARRGLMELMMVLQGVQIADPRVRGETVEGYYLALAPELPWGWATLGAACLVAVVGAWGAARGDRRTVAAWIGLVWLPAAALIFAFGEIGPERMTQLAEALP